jgi:hypothetical protein
MAARYAAGTDVPAESLILAALRSGDRPTARALLAERIHDREHPIPVATDNERR